LEKAFCQGGDGGVQEFRSSGVQEFRSSGVQEFLRRDIPLDLRLYL
jgi:hypothetical protein